MSSAAYPSLARPQQQKSIASMESTMEALCKSGSLFEVPVPDYKQLKACHKEVRLLKELWDMIVMVRAMAGPCTGEGNAAGTQGGGGRRGEALGCGGGPDGTRSGKGE